MANASATPKTPRRRRRVTFLARTCHRLLRLLATHRLRRGGHGLNSISAGDDSPPSGQPPRGRDAEEAEATQAAAAAQRRHEERHGDDDAAATEEAEAAVAGKYWAQRRSLFSLYDRGVRMDAEGWYSATPEPIAAAQAARAPPGSLVLDAFAGVGGNSIQFAARHAAATTSISLHLQPRSLTTPSPLQGLLRGRRGDRPPEGGARGAQRQDLRRRRHDRVRRRRFLPPRALLEGMLIPLLNDTEKETKKNEASMLRI